MRAYPMLEVRKIFPEEPSQIEKYIERINKCIKNALESKERKIIYLFDRVLDSEEIDEIFKIYRSEGYNITIEHDYFIRPRINIYW